MSIQDLIASKSGSLTPTERRIARVVLDDPTQIAFGSVAGLAEKASTSRPSIVRFATKLGFEGYADLQSWMQERLTRQLSSPSQRIRDHGPHAPRRVAVERAVSRTFNDLDDQRLAAMAAPIVRARNVWVLSGETSMAGAHVLTSGLTMVRPGVHLVMEHAAGRDLCGASPGDVAVVFDFSRYRRTPIVAARALADAGLDLVAITDGPLSPLASLTPTWCALTIPAVGPFDSSVPAVIAAELLVARVVLDLGDEARERIDRLESLWQSIGEFLTYTPRAERNGHPGRDAARGD
ncbi:MAG: MurR/RpiR family transcriptional regulator [Phycisphaerales bacterium]|nr:MurR/RpiR family transcriptional regulator [Phycisphaerales bacterium]